MSEMSGKSPIGTMRVLRPDGTSQIPPVPARDPGADGAHPGQGTSAWRRRSVQWFRSSWVDIGWAGFAGLNLAAMRLLPAWQTVPFLAIWVSLTAIYGFWLWRLQPTILTWAAVTLATGGIILVQVLKGQQDADYLAEVPLIALMFLVMVWHGRRRLAAMRDRLAAMEELQRISGENLRLLEQQRQFPQDASHELGTPITVALGHTELIQQAVTDQVVAEDARVVAGELARLRRLAQRLLLLASAGSPDFLHPEPVEAGTVVLDAVDRWGHMPRRWRLGELAEATVLADRDRLAVALDALLENAVAHTAAEDRIEVSARLDGGCAVFAVTDDGCGIPAAELDRIFARFARVRPYRSRAAGGFGLGLPIVQAIAEALCVPRISSAAVICRVDLLAGWRVLAGAGPSREQGALRIRVEGQGRPGRLTPGRLAVRLGRDLQPSGASVPLVPGGLPAGWRGA